MHDRVVGREREIELILAALDAERDLLLEGPPGTSKTTLLRAITDAWNVPLVFVEGNAELTPGRLLGHHDPARVLREGYSIDTFEPGPLTEAMETGGFLYFEEFNRAPEDTLNTLLTAIADRRLTIPRVGTIEALPTFRVIGSMNPYDTVGTTRLSVSIKDRLNRLTVDYQDPAAEEEIVGRRRPQVLGSAIGSQIVADAVRLTRATRDHRDIRQGSSVRGAIDLTAVAWELCRKRRIATAEDPAYREAIWDATLMALSGRISIDHAADTDEATVLREIFEAAFRGVTWTDENLDSAVTREVPQPPPGSTQDVTDHANRKFRVKPKELASDPDLSAGGGGVGLATAGENSPEARRGRPPGSSGLSSDEAGLDDEEGETAGPSAEARARALEIATRMRLGEPVPLPNRSRGGDEIHSLPYGGADDEIDLDRTLDTLGLENRAPRREEIIVRERRRTRRQIVLAIDVSGSMGAERLLTSAATIGALASRLHHEELAIIAFWSHAAALLRLGERAPVDRLVDAILGLDAKGLTNISFPLQVAGQELGGPSNYEQRVLLLSDCVHNSGPDPRLAAARLPRVDVLFDVGGERDSEIAAQIARSGRGQVIPIRSYRDVPDGLARIFVPAT